MLSSKMTKNKNWILDGHFVAFGIEFEKNKHQGNKIGCIESTLKSQENSHACIW